MSEPLSGQSWNPYSYVGNNPLNYVDPSGFDKEGEDAVRQQEEWRRSPEAQRQWAEDCIGTECRRPPQEVEGSREAVQVGAATRPLDVSTTGSAPGHVAQSTLATVGKAITGFGLGVGDSTSRIRWRTSRR